MLDQGCCDRRLAVVFFYIYISLTPRASLQGSSSAVETTKEILQVAYEYCKNLYGFEPRANIHHSHDFWSPSEFVSHAENTLLEKPFSEEQTKNAIFKSYVVGWGAPRPDGLSFLLYQQN